MAEVRDATEASNGSEKIRMSLDLTPEMKAVVDGLVGKAGATRADVLRRAIALLKTVKDAEAQGEMPALIDHEGHVKARLVGI